MATVKYGRGMIIIKKPWNSTMWPSIVSSSFRNTRECGNSGPRNKTSQESTISPIPRPNSSAGPTRRDPSSQKGSPIDSHSSATFPTKKHWPSSPWPCKPTRPFSWNTDCSRYDPPWSVSIFKTKSRYGCTPISHLPNPKMATAPPSTTWSIPSFRQSKSMRILLKNMWNLVNLSKSTKKRSNLVLMRCWVPSKSTEIWTAYQNTRVFLGFNTT